jgi:hypothetical protein
MLTRGSASQDHSGAGSDQHRARELLHALSWRVEKMHRQRGHLRGYIWVAENEQGDRQWFETECEADPRKVSDAEGLAALRAELREDFARDGVVRYAVAFPARATTVIRQSILHLAGEVVRQQVVCIEAHDGDVHLRAQCEVHGDSLSALAAVEESPGCFAVLC